LAIWPLLASLESVVLTVGRASPVALATSLAVNAPLCESALSTLVFVAPDAGFAGGLAVLAARVRVRAVGDLGERRVTDALLPPALLLASRGGVADCRRGSSAISARRNLSASASNWSRRSLVRLCSASATVRGCAHRTPQFASHRRVGRPCRDRLASLHALRSNCQVVVGETLSGARRLDRLGRGLKRFSELIAAPRVLRTKLLGTPVPGSARGCPV
jgi:hypothetical protein